jgi:hypothetical protein
MGDLLSRLVRILGVLRFGAVDETRDDRPGTKKISQRAQRLRSRRRLSVGADVRPRRRDQTLGTIRQDQTQVEPPVAAHPAEHRQRAPLEGMPTPHDRRLSRKVPDVGSVSPARSTTSITSCYCTWCGNG